MCFKNLRWDRFLGVKATPGNLVQCAVLREPSPDTWPYSLIFSTGAHSSSKSSPFRGPVDKGKG